MFDKKHINIYNRDAILISNLNSYSLRDTLECGQCFRHVCVRDEADYVEYMTVIFGKLIFVGQRNDSELIFTVSVMRILKIYAFRILRLIPITKKS